MKKEKFHIEYLFDKASKNSLWNHIATSTGLSEWFADEVTNNDKIFTFIWDSYPEEAEVIGIIPNSYIRFRWIKDENTNYFFEFKLHKNELTNGLVLEITDFIEPSEKEDTITLWNSQIKVLTRILGL